MRTFRILPLLVAVILSASEPLTNENIIRMVQSGVPADLIVKTIRTADSFRFSMLPGDLIALGQAKVPEDVIRAMAARINGPAPAPTSAVTQGQPAVAGSQPPAPGSSVRPARSLEYYRGDVIGGVSYLNGDTN